MKTLTDEKARLRIDLRDLQKKAARAVAPSERALIFFRPPNPLLDLIPEGATIGLYHALAHEVPTNRLARWFAEQGHTIALPRFASRDAPMHFAAHSDPFGESDLEAGPFGISQPGLAAEEVVPSVVCVPLLGFTSRGDRIGQGAGHYDRWLANHADVLRIGLAWDAQEVDEIPTEPHDIPLNAVLTPSRLIGPFA
ncbi:5-formyltetrahydrofolate cyclo-ligase [Erythrobacter sp. LQ02-29]|uniref:5-formyltetrahydrofolate cyclo-ligase n=1 Tax=Erythrobacter sp. LQ02-29 TaxID=2920384 RepID=UPI001F4E6018|nr:5-formyltetrahydrofolate cyclo-ligase [Erythrobacter sp. LQ02-29]